MLLQTIPLNPCIVWCALQFYVQGYGQFINSAFFYWVWYIEINCRNVYYVSVKDTMYFLFEVNFFTWAFI